MYYILTLMRDDLLIWLDLEMTGLDPEKQVIIEIGCALTTADLEIYKEGPTIVIHQSPEAMKHIDPWCVKQHGDSGLLKRVENSTISLAQAEQQVLSFLKAEIKPQSSPLCGNSIGQDRRFLYKYMPTLSEFFHYRNVDVSSIKELVKRWYGPSMEFMGKNKTHQVMDDIRESILELKHYRKNVFK